MPVGGWKMSGVGLENGEEGIKAYLRNKSTLVQLGKGACSGVFEVVIEGGSSSSSTTHDGWE